MSASPAKDRLQSIQLLRAFAALFVVVLHSYTRTLAAQPDPGPSISSLFALSGNAGVDLFFVISGYIMFHVHHDDFGKGRSGSFLLKRLIRIAPIYWILSTVALLVIVFVPSMFVVPRTLDPLWIAGSYLFFPVEYAPSLNTPLLQVGWTLNYEAYFYLVLAAFLFLPRRIAVVGITLLFVGSVAVGMMRPFAHPWPQMLTSWLLLEFLLGGFIALFQHASGNRFRTAHLAGLAVGLVLLAASFPMGRLDEDVTRFVFWGLPSVLIVNGVCRLRYEPKGWFGRAFVTLGDASYSIYLVQVFSLPAAALVLGRLGILTGAPVDVNVILLTVATALAGWLTWRIVERPLTRWLRRTLEPREPRAVTP